MSLQDSVDAVLIDGLKPSLKKAIDDLVAAKVHKKDVLRYCRSVVDGRGSLTLAAIEAYLLKKP